MTQAEKISFQLSLSDVFRPGAPIDSKALFSGREKQVNDVINAIFQVGQHVVIYGEKGVGKTSLAKTLADLLQTANITPLSSGTINCDGTDDFSKLWHKIFRELQVVIKSKVPGFSPEEQESEMNLDALLPEKVAPDDVRVAICQAIKMAANNKRMILILDEVDRITKRGVTTLLADTLKNLSDHLVPVTLVFVGVADAVDQLISEHKSIERSLVQVPMPRMSAPELQEVIEKGFLKAGMTIADDAKKHIMALSQGLPHFTHLLSLESSFVALAGGRINVTDADVFSATKNAVEKSHSLRSSYDKAINSPQSNSLYKQVLLACAMAKKTELGWFSGTSVIDPLSSLMGKEYSLPYFARHLGEFALDKRGPVLQRYTASKQHKYRFINPLLEPFTVIHAISSGLIKNSSQQNPIPTNAL